jgi:MoaA/NifB/PqqE/SkfB family radical SAM enzyme
MMDYIKKFLNLHAFKPVVTNLDLTYSCPLHCISCRRGSRRAYEDELQLRDYRKIFQELSDMAIRSVVISGGEPFMRKDIFKILRESIANNISPHIVTNGFLLNRHKIKTLGQIGINSLSISLNSSDERIHDATRGVKGSFNRIISAIPELKKAKIKIILFTLILRQNLDTIPDLILWAKENDLHIKFQMFVSPDLMFYTKDSAQKKEKIAYNQLWFRRNDSWILNDQKMQDVFGQIIGMKSNRFPILNPVWQLRYFKQYYMDPLQPLPFRCEIGGTNLSIDPYGNVRLCYGMPFIGNAKEENIFKLWNSMDAANLRKEINHCPLNCKLMQCSY